MNTYHKICSKCKITKPLAEFNKNKSSKDGFRSQCKTCGKGYYQDNKESHIMKVMQYYYDNIQKKTEYNHQYYQDNKERVLSNVKSYRENNKEQLREYDTKYKKDRRENDPLFALSNRISRSINKSLSKNNCTKKSRTNEILGCSYEEFHTHIENQFMEGMSWDNRSEWHLDHITPVSWGKTEEEIIALNHYTNFQPLWAIDNIRKGNRYSD